MKKITESRRLLGATGTSTLKELNTLYKGLMKQHHPDRFQETAEREDAERTSKEVIDAYKFLESIHPETHAKDAEGYTRLTETAVISDWQYKSLTLSVTFGDGSVYEYHGVPNNIYKKFVNTNGNARFARRHIFHGFSYRKRSNAAVTEQAWLSPRPSSTACPCRASRTPFRPCVCRSAPAPPELEN